MARRLSPTPFSPIHMPRRCNRLDLDLYAGCGSHLSRWSFQHCGLHGSRSAFLPEPRSDIQWQRPLTRLLPVTWSIRPRLRTRPASPIPNLANNTATDTDLHPIADLAVAISDQVITYTLGGSVIYTITVTNNGPSNVINAPFSAAIPTQLISWTWTCAAQVGASCTSEGFLTGSQTLQTLALSIPAGRSVIYTVVANINAAATGP